MSGAILSLSCEMILTTAMVVLAVLLIIRSRDNRYKQIWGMLVIAMGALLLLDNYKLISSGGASFRVEQIASMSMSIEWFLFSQVFTLAVTGSFRPGYLTTNRLLALSLPLIITTTVVVCYKWLDGSHTPLDNAGDLLRNIDQTDVQIRLGAFLLSIINPLIYMIFPLIWRKAPLRKPTKGA